MSGQINGSWMASRRAVVRATRRAIKKTPSLVFARPREGDRYIVTSITGYAITPDMHSLDTEGKRKTEWYILDTCDAHRIVATFNRRNAEQLAKRTAARLNDDERRWEREGE